MTFKKAIFIAVAAIAYIIIMSYGLYFLRQ
jgi:hypothetical protein